MIANTLSLGLELLGVLMASIEVMRPSMADRIEAVLCDLGSMQVPPRAEHVQYALTWKLFIGIEVAAMLSTYAYLFSGPGLAQANWLRDGGNASGMWGGLSSVAGFIAMLLALVFLPVLVPVVVLRLVAWALHKVDHVWKGRAFGAVGLAIALLGMVVSVFQVLAF